MKRTTIILDPARHIVPAGGDGARSVSGQGTP
jgi:hypothetical protein